MWNLMNLSGYNLKYMFHFGTLGLLHLTYNYIY